MNFTPGFADGFYDGLEVDGSRILMHLEKNGAFVLFRVSQNIGESSRQLPLSDRTTIQIALAVDVDDDAGLIIFRLFQFLFGCRFSTKMAIILSSSQNNEKDKQ